MRDDYTTFEPGQPVFFQGEVRQEYYGLTQGRFAKVKLTDSNPDVPMAERLANAVLLEIFDEPGQIFGEIDALLKKPHEFSVFALEESGATPIPTAGESLQNIVTGQPEIGIKTCISLARTLRATIERLERLSRIENDLRRLQSLSAQALLAVTSEIEQIRTGAFSTIASILEFVRTHKAFDRAKGVAAKTWLSKPAPSVSNAVIQGADLSNGAREFSTGTFLCRKGLPGNRLFILTGGAVDVVLDNDHRIRIDRPGSIIGEIAVLERLDGRNQDSLRTANVVCLTPVSAIVIEQEHIRDFFSSHPGMLSGMMFGLVTRTNETLKLVSGLCSTIRRFLFTELGAILEAHHGIASRLDTLRRQNPALERPFHSCANQSREIYNAFSAALGQIEKP
ncbi:MAG TPA: cyclic nucleotide-binding domain-containing protein [Candidatus Ozemobacteraceae bacterium]|nr:cyclic nucleotide-binding domain-containing protein [Candidatus Ozemobacteraceae bacterium]